MFKRCSIGSILLCSLFSLTTVTKAQGPCSAASDKLICTTPQVYGAQGLSYNSQAGPLISFGSNPPAGFTGSFIGQGKFIPFNTGIATQIAFLPFVAPASGLTFTLSKSLGVPVASNDSFGPILSERATTVGRYRLAIGFNYQHSNFDSLDGIDMHNFQWVNRQANRTFGGTLCSLNGGVSSSQNTGDCGVIRDYITSKNSIDLTANEYTTFLTFGIAKRLDVSAAIPVVNVRMSMKTSATIVPNSLSGAVWFTNPSLGPLCSGVVANPPTFPLPPSLLPCLNESFSNAHSATGLGDVTLRIKGTLWEGEHAALGAGLDVRFPTGDEQNFLGAGAYGIKPFIVWSYGGRVSPHVNIGYEWNGTSILAGDPTLGTRKSLPNQMLYSAGFEAGLVKRLTATFDLVGQRVFDAPRVGYAPVTVLGACATPATSSSGNCVMAQVGPPVTLNSIVASSGSYGINNASVGIRFLPFSKFLISANVLIKLDNGGMRSQFSPMVSAIYTIH
jgi:hypothetical protein